MAISGHQWPSPDEYPTGVQFRHRSPWPADARDPDRARCSTPDVNGPSEPQSEPQSADVQSEPQSADAQSEPQSADVQSEPQSKDAQSGPQSADARVRDRARSTPALSDVRWVAINGQSMANQWPINGQSMANQWPVSPQPCGICGWSPSPRVFHCHLRQRWQCAGPSA